MAKARPGEPERTPAAQLSDLFTEKSGALLEFFTDQTLDPEASADLVSETFAAAVEAAQEQSLLQPSGEWLDTLATFVLSRYYRSTSGMSVRQHEIPVANLDQPPDWHVEEDARLRSLSLDVATLPERSRVVFALHYRDGMNFDEIAERLGIEEVVIRVYHAQGLRQLAVQRELEELGDKPQPVLLDPDGRPLIPGSSEHRKFQLEVSEIGDELIELLAANADLLYTLPPRRFEELVAELYMRRGFEVMLTPPSQDGGVDLYVIRHDELGSSLTVVDCKRHAQGHKVGVGLVRQLHGVVERTRASAGVLLTTSFFTRPAREHEEEFKYRLALHDYYALQRLLGLARRPRGPLEAIPRPGKFPDIARD